MRTASLALASGLLGALVVTLIPGQFKGVTAALLVAIALAAVVTTLSSGSRRGEHPSGEEYPRWVFIVTLLGVGATNLLAVRLPGNLTIGDALLTTALVGLVVHPDVTSTAIRAMPRWFWWSTSLILLSGAAATLRPEVTGPANISTAFRTWWAMALVPFMIVAVASTGRRLHAIAAAFVLGASLSAFAAIAQTAGLWNPAAALGVQFFPGRATGLSVHPNHLGFASAMAAPIGLALAAQAIRPLGRYTWGALWLVLALGVTSSGSRAALGGLLLGSLLLLLLLLLPATRSWRRRAHVRGPVVALPLGLIGVALALWLFPQMAVVSDSLLAIASRIRSPDALAQSDAGRLQYYSEGIVDVGRYWLIGRGFEESTQDHNIFLQALLSGGVVLLAGLIVYIWKPVTQAVRRLTEASDPILWGALTSFLLWPVMGLVQNNLRDRYLFVALGLMLAVLRAAPSHSSESTPADHGAAPGRRTPAAKLRAHPVTASSTDSPEQAGPESAATRRSHR